MGVGDEGRITHAQDIDQLAVPGRVGGDDLGFWSWVSFV